MSGEPLALYVHWPFCVSKCPYCDFNSHVRTQIDQDEWREALLADLAHEAHLLPGPTADLDFLRRRDAVLDGACNRRCGHRCSVYSLERRQAASRSRSRPIRTRWKQLGSPISRRPGVNRVSLGLQSFDDRGARLPRPRPFRARRLCRAGDRTEALPASQLRSDLRAAGRDRGQLVGHARAGAFARNLAPFALPTDDRARHALREHGRARRVRRRSMPTLPPRFMS